MNIILISSDRFACSLVQELSEQGHHVCSLDQFGKKRNRPGLPGNSQYFKGMQFDSGRLAEADIEHADALLAMTDDDNVNLMASLIAKEVYHIPNVVSKTNNPDKNNVYTMLQITAINPVQAEVELIKSNLQDERHVMPEDRKGKRSWFHSIS
jgi:trk system potassium uptake protein TrkA